jgi:hypothetical protein
MEAVRGDVLGIAVVLVSVFVIVDVILSTKEDGEDGRAVIKLRVLVALALLMR